MSTHSKVLVPLHMATVSVVAALVASGFKKQRHVIKMDGALAGIPFMDIKKAEHFDDLASGLSIERNKLHNGGLQGQARKLLTDAVATVTTMKRTFETAGAGGTAANHAGAGNGLDSHAAIADSRG